MSFGPELVWIWTRRLSALKGRRIQRIEGANSSVILSFGSQDMLLSWGTQNCGAVLITTKEKKSLTAAATQTPPVTNALRSHLTGAQLVNIEQLRRDRIMRFEFHRTVGAGFSSVRNVILEVMERYSNLLITDEDGIILETAKHIHPADNPFRTILPGLPYHLPPQFEGIELEDWLAAPSDAAIGRIAGFGKPLLKKLAEGGATFAAGILSEFYKKTDKSGTENFITQKLGRYVTSLPVLLDGAEAEKNDAGRIVALEPLKNSSSSARLKKIEHHLTKEIVRRERQRADILTLLSSEDDVKFKRWGELLVANMWQIKQPVSEAAIKSYGENGEEEANIVPLDVRISPSKNAERYFAKYKKLSAAKRRSAELLAKVESELADFREELDIAESLTEMPEIEMMEDELGLSAAPVQKRGGAKKKEILPPHKRFDFACAIVVAGLSAKGNRYATFKFAQSDDVWFHAQGVPGSHVILRITGAADDEEQELLYKFCASLAANYSKAHSSARQRVDYTLRKHVSPIKGGEANVTYKEFSTMSADPAEWQELERLAAGASE